MISVNNVGIEFSAKPLFSGANFVVNPTDKIALAGKNGAGKSTLLKVMAGLQRPTEGSVSMPDGTTVGYLPQQMEVADSTTVMDEVKKAFSKALSRKEEIDAVAARLAQRTDYESEEYAALIERLDYLNNRLAIENVADIDAEAERTLMGLGFERSDFQRPTSEFSGGWRMRIELAKLLLRRPDVLLLDEPTNHLDIESIQWLEQFMLQKARAVVLVSHDRAFLDNVTKRTIEISCGKLYDYKVNYTQYETLRQERLEQQRRAYDNQQKIIADTRDFIERFRYKPTKASQVQSRMKMLEKMVPIEIDEVDRSRLHLKFPPAPRSGDFPLIEENVAKAYGEHLVFSEANLTLRRGEKVAFVGKNGEGKSTMVKCIMGEIPFTGDLKLGHNVKIGYFAQNQAQLLDGDLTVFETIDRVAVGDIRTRIRDILGAFMFGGEASDKPVKVLSGGEKTRLAMIKLLLEPVNFLILDEPTNHLDLQSKEILKEAIKAFDGTVIVVSHDRAFLDGLVDKVYVFGHGKVREHLGGIYDYLSTLSSQAAPASLPAAAPVSTKTEEKPEEKTEPSKAQSYAERREQEKAKRRALKAIEKAEEEITRLEGIKAEIEEKLAQGVADPETLKEYEKTQKALDNAMSVWELANMEAESFL